MLRNFRRFNAAMPRFPDMPWRAKLIWWLFNTKWRWRMLTKYRWGKSKRIGMTYQSHQRSLPWKVNYSFMRFSSDADHPYKGWRRHYEERWFPDRREFWTVDINTDTPQDAPHKTPEWWLYRQEAHGNREVWDAFEDCSPIKPSHLRIFAFFLGILLMAILPVMMTWLAITYVPADILIRTLLAGSMGLVVGAGLVTTILRQ